MTHNRNNFKDITHNRYGKLTVTGFAGTINNRTRWFCICDCGNTTIAAGAVLRRGSKQSCGCLKSECCIRRNTIHGQTRSREHRIWSGMLARCTNPMRSAFVNYGGRGIAVCDEWLSFANFLADMGRCPEGMSLDRVDNSIGYNKENCRWATRSEQASNRRTNRVITHNGLTMCLQRWSEHTGIKRETIARRIDNGWTVRDALETVVI